MHLVPARPAGIAAALSAVGLAEIYRIDSELAGRQRWECRRCRRQTSPRNGTVMERSRLRLTIWFKAIHRVLLEPEIQASQLAEAIGVARLATVRRVKSRILAALEAGGTRRRLAEIWEGTPPATEW